MGAREIIIIKETNLKPLFRIARAHGVDRECVRAFSGYFLRTRLSMYACAFSAQRLSSCFLPRSRVRPFPHPVPYPVAPSVRTTFVFPRHTARARARENSSLITAHRFSGQMDLRPLGKTLYHHRYTSVCIICMRKHTHACAYTHVRIHIYISARDRK